MLRTSTLLLVALALAPAGLALEPALAGTAVLAPDAPAATADAPAALDLGRVVGADGALLPFAGWRVTLSPTLEASLVGPGPVRALSPWTAVADLGDRRCLVRTEARSAEAVFVTVRIEPASGAPQTALLRWDVASGRWSDVRPS